MPEDLRWNAATLWAGPKCHIVHYPLSGWKLFNLVVTYHNDAPAPVAGRPVDAEEVFRGFHHVHPRAQKSCVAAPTGRPGCCAIANRSTAGSTAAWPCSAMPRIRCCSISPRAPAWRWKTRCAWPTPWPGKPTMYRRRSTPTGGNASCVPHASSCSRGRSASISTTRPDPHAALRNAILQAKSEDEMHDTVAWLYGGNGLAAGPAANVGR